MTTALKTPEQYVHFRHLSPEDQDTEREMLRIFREIERPLFEGVPTIPNIEAADKLIYEGKLELADWSQTRLFGVANPIRNRIKSPNCDRQGSIPYLTPNALEVAKSMMSEVKSQARNHEFGDVLEEFGFADFRPSFTSLARTTYYQRIISAEEGQLAAGTEGEDDHSTHETANTYDVDHTGFSVFTHEGRELAINPNTAERANRFTRLRPLFNDILSSVVEIYQTQGTVVALNEVPGGWGVFHVAVLPRQ